jgi:transposase
MRAYSMDLRARVLTAVDGGAGTRAVAERFAVSASWVRRLKQRRAATGEVAPRPGGRRPPALAADADRIRAAVRSTPDATLAELKAGLGLAVSLATLWRAVHALGLTVKKKRSGRPNRTGRT